jgi:hypothetical protein
VAGLALKKVACPPVCYHWNFGDGKYSLVWYCSIGSDHATQQEQDNRCVPRKQPTKFVLPSEVERRALVPIALRYSGAQQVEPSANQVVERAINLVRPLAHGESRTLGRQSHHVY